MAEAYVNTSTEQLVPDNNAEISPETPQDTSDDTTATESPTPETEDTTTTTTAITSLTTDTATTSTVTTTATTDTTTASTPPPVEEVEISLTAENSVTSLPRRLRAQVLHEFLPRSTVKAQLHSDHSSDSDPDPNDAGSSSPSRSHRSLSSFVDVPNLNKEAALDNADTGAIPAEHNPVSDLLRFTDDDSPALFVPNKRDSFFCHSIPDLAMTEFYSRTDIEFPDIKIKKTKKKKRNALHKLKKNNKSTVDLPAYQFPTSSSSSRQPDVLPSPQLLQSNAGQSIDYLTRFLTVDDSSDEEEQPLTLFNLMTENYSTVNLPLEDSVEEPLEEPVQEIVEEPVEQPTYSLEQRRSLRRINSIKELMETEDSYNRDLIILCNHYLKCIGETDCISKEDAELLIRNAPEILSFQDKFMRDLEKAHGNDKIEKNGIVYVGNLKEIAICFVEWGPDFAIYQDYCVRHDKAVSKYNELLETNLDFKALIEQLHQFHRVSFGFNKLKFDDYLIIPVQRIFRYKLLLDGITRAVQKDAEEYDLLTKAQDIFHGICTSINVRKAEVEAERKTDLFLSRLESTWSLNNRWYKTLGCCLLIGTLEVRVDGKSKRFGCALFNHYMIMAKARKPDQYEAKHWFPLRQFTLVEYPAPNSCSFMLYNELHSLELTATCETEKQIWIDNLRIAVKKSKEAYTNSTEKNDYLVEQFFVSSFEQNSQSKQPAIEANAPVHLPLPSGSMSFSQSAIFHRPNRNDNRASHPVYSAQDYSMPEISQNTKSPGIRPQSSFGDLKDFFTINVSDWTGRKSIGNHFKSVDTKFDDVCSTPLLTARTNSMNKSRKTSYVQKPSIDGDSSRSFVFSPSTAGLSEGQSSTQSSRRPSMNIVTQQRQPSLRRKNSTTTEPPAAGLLPPSSSTLSLTGRSSKFFGKVVEKLSQIGTPGRFRRNNMMKPPAFQEAESSSKRKFFGK